MKKYRNLIYRLIVSLLFVFFSGGAFADTSKDPQHLRKPFLVIWQQGGEPNGDPKLDTPWGLVGAVWEDGWVIRAKNKNLVGQTYVEGYAREKEFKDFLHLVASPRNIATPDIFAVTVDAPSLSITLWYGNKKHEWTRSIPGDQGMFNDIETRTWGLPLEKSAPAPSKDWDQKQFRPR
jgi:hypothetical protein